MTKHASRIAAGLAALVLAVTSTTACSSEKAPSIEDASKQFPKNRMTWALPLDGFQNHSDVLQYQAQQLLERACMSKAGYDDYPYVVVNLDAPPSASESPSGQRNFNVPLASKWGYRKAPSQQINWYERQEKWAAFNKRSSEAEKQQLTKCSNHATNEVSDGFNLSELQRAAGLGGQEDPRTRPDVQAATKKWAACMKPMGLADLPADPLEMPMYAEAPATEESETSQNLDTLVYAEKVPDREIKIATADAECRESSGYAQAFYDAEYEADLKAYIEHEDELQRIKKLNDDFKKHLQQIIDQNS